MGFQPLFCTMFRLNNQNGMTLFGGNRSPTLPMGAVRVKSLLDAQAKHIVMFLHSLKQSCKHGPLDEHFPVQTGGVPC